MCIFRAFDIEHNKTISQNSIEKLPMDIVLLERGNKRV